MKLYHGSTLIVDKPLVSFGCDNLDFGKGFYTTSMQSQAEKWVQRFISLEKKGIIDKSTALQRLKFEKTNNQICFINQEVVDRHLHFESSYEAKGEQA